MSRFKEGQGGHLDAHEEWATLIDDLEAGNVDKYPGLIGPIGPPGPEGPEGPQGEHGETPTVLHQVWKQTCVDGDMEFIFETDPEADTGIGFDPDQVHVHLNGILLQQLDDYKVRVEPNPASVEEYNLIVTLTEPAFDDDVLHVEVLFAFAISPRSQRSGKYMVDFGDVGGAERLDIDNEDYRKLHGDRLFIVIND